METIITEINRALDCGLTYLAVMVSLSLPDVCAALESPNGQTSRKKYVAWYNTWLAADYPQLTGDDFYRLRCGVLHQGRFRHPKMRYARVFFLVGDAGQVLHKNVLGDSYQLSAPWFCKDVMDAAARWYQAKHADANVQANLPHVAQLREDGLEGYLLGSPVIA